MMCVYGVLIVNCVYWYVVIIVMRSLIIVSGFGLNLLNKIFEIGDIISIMIVSGSRSRLDWRVVNLIRFCR